MACQKNKCKKSYCDEYESTNYYDEYESGNYYDEYDSIDYYDEYESGDYYHKHGKCHDDEEEQRHVHEYSSNVKLAEDCPERHTHHISGVTGEAIYTRDGRNHVHKVIKDNTDFFDHYHQICDTTGPAIKIDETGKHIHLLCGNTTVNDDHCHRYLFVTQIDAPLK